MGKRFEVQVHPQESVPLSGYSPGLPTVIQRKASTKRERNNGRSIGNSTSHIDTLRAVGNTYLHSLDVNRDDSALKLTLAELFMFKRSEKSLFSHFLCIIAGKVEIQT